MAFDVDAFSAEINSTGWARNSHFELEVGGDILSKVGGGFAMSSSMAFRCSTAIMPGRNIENVAYRDYGVPYKMGIEANYVDMQIGIILSPDLREREFFMRWQDLVGGMHRNPGLSASQRRTQFNVGYYDDYVCKRGITVYKLDQQGFKTYAVDLMDSYPAQITGLSLDWSSDVASILNVNMSYRYFEERNQRELGTQLRIGRDGLQIGGGLNIPFSIEGIKNQLGTKFNPRKLRTAVGRHSPISFSGKLPKIGI